MNHFTNGIPLAVDWGLIGAVATIVSIPAGALVACTLYRRQQAKQLRAFGFEVTARPLVQVRAAARDLVEIRYRGEPVEGVNLVEIAFRNTGNQALTRNDFEQAIRIDLPSGCGPIASTLAATGDPTDIEPEVRFSGDTAIEIEPLLLNPGDRLVVTVMVRSAAEIGDTRIRARIAGIREPEQSVDRPQPPVPIGDRIFEATIVLVGLIALAGVVLSVLFGSSRYDDRVVLKTGKEHCAHVERVGEDLYLTIPVEDAERVLIVPRAGVARIAKDDC